MKQRMVRMLTALGFAIALTAAAVATAAEPVTTEAAPATTLSGAVERLDSGAATIWVDGRAFPLSGVATSHYELSGRSLPLDKLEPGTAVVLHFAAGSVVRIEEFKPVL